MKAKSTFFEIENFCHNIKFKEMMSVVMPIVEKHKCHIVYDTIFSRVYNFTIYKIQRGNDNLDGCIKSLHECIREILESTNIYAEKKKDYGLYNPFNFEYCHMSMNVGKGGGDVFKNLVNNGRIAPDTKYVSIQFLGFKNEMLSYDLEDAMTEIERSLDGSNLSCKLTIGKSQSDGNCNPYSAIVLYEGKCDAYGQVDVIKSVYTEARKPEELYVSLKNGDVSLKNLRNYLGY